MECGENEIYDIREECPKTCKNPDGEYDCGAKIKTEGCFCKTGFVEFNNTCVKADQCGCSIPNETLKLDVIKIFKKINKN